MRDEAPDAESAIRRAIKDYDINNPTEAKAAGREADWLSEIALPCPTCGGRLWVCEEHPGQPMDHGGCTGPGMPCPTCNWPAPGESPRLPPGFIPTADEDGSIGSA